MLEMENISFAYSGKELLLRNISFSLSCGEWVLLYGRNGSGKTTLAQILLGLLRPESGSYFIDGKDASRLSLREMGQRIGFVRQDADKQLVGETVGQEMVFPAKFRGEIADSARNLLEKFSLGSSTDVSPLTLSYGEKKRLAIAAVLLRQPGILVLDEPTAGLDGKSKKELLDYLHFLQTELSLAIFLVSHDLEAVLPYASRVLCLQDKCIAFDGTPQDAVSFLPEEELPYFLTFSKRLGQIKHWDCVLAPEELAEKLKGELS